MKEPKQPIQEIVWTGTSDRTHQAPAEPAEPEPAETSPAAEQAPHKPRKAVRIVARAVPKPREPAQPASPPVFQPAPQPAPQPAQMMPPPPPAEPPSHTIPSPASKSRVLAETVVATFVDRLTAEAERKGGSLTISDIKALNEEFEKKTQVLQTVFEKSFEEYVNARERAVWDQKREFPFDRQLVDRFAHLFPSGRGNTLETGAISRRVLPAFFVALNLMLGHDVVEDYQEKCRAIVQDLKKKRGKTFSWEDVDDDKDINNIILDAVIGMANHFEAAEKRSGWFRNLINDNLGPPDVAGEGPRSADWQLSDEGFSRFMAALFSIVRETMETETGRLQITKRHGADTTALVFDILKGLDKIGLG